MEYKVGIDLGGTKIEIIAFDQNNIQCYQKRIYQNFSGNNNLDYQGVLNSITDLIKEMKQSLKIKSHQFSLGIGTPGSLGSNQKLRNSNSQCLNNRYLKKDLESKLKIPIKIANDANCFTLSEAVDGVAKDAEVVFGVIVGTGSGGGIVVNKRPINGVNSIAGEWAHNPLPYPDKNLGEIPGAKCYCGRFGCIETWLAGPSLAKDYYNHTGHKKTAKQIAKEIKNDILCDQALKRYERRMAKSLAVVINILDPDVIVLGGGISKIDRLYQNVPKLWSEYIFSNEVHTKLLPPKFGDASGVRGAAWL